MPIKYGHSSRWRNRIRGEYSSNYIGKTSPIRKGNQTIVDDPSKVNADPEGEGWFFKVKVKDKSQLNNLMSKDDYEKFIKDNPS